MKNEESLKRKSRLTPYFVGITLGSAAVLGALIYQDVQEMKDLNNRLEQVAKEMMENSIELSNVLNERQFQPDNTEVIFETDTVDNGRELFIGYFGKKSIDTMRIEGEALVMNLIDGGPIPRSQHYHLTTSTMTHDYATKTTRFDVHRTNKSPRISEHGFAVFTPEYKQTIDQFACEAAEKQKHRVFLEKYCPSSP